MVITIPTAALIMGAEIINATIISAAHADATTATVETISLLKHRYIA